VEAANRKGISPIPVEPPPWRARCIERCPAGSGRGGWKRAAFLILPARGILSRQVGTTSGTSPTAYFIRKPVNDWPERKGGSYLLNRQENERTGYVCPISSKLNKV
jgi:hypothetical protein